MELLFFVGGILQFFIFIFILLKFLKHYSFKNNQRVIRPFFSLAILYLVFSLSSFLWAFNILNYNLEDFLFQYSVFVFIQNLILFSIIYLFSKNKKLFFLLFLQFLSIFFLLYDSNKFFIFSLISSFLFSLLFFIDLIFRGDNYRRVGYLGIFYSVMGIVFSFIFIFSESISYSLSLILHMIFFLFLVHFFKDLAYYKIRNIFTKPRKRSYFFVLLSHLIFVITLVNFIFIGTVAIHEFGHFSVSKLSGCESQKIIYQNDFFHTEFLCSNSQDQTFVILAGVVLPFILALFLFFVGGDLMKEISLLVGGFNLISISSDLVKLGVSQITIALVTFFGFILIIYGILLLSKNRTEESLYFDNSSFVKNHNFKEVSFSF